MNARNESRNRLKEEDFEGESDSENEVNACWRCGSEEHYRESSCPTAQPPRQPHPPPSACPRDQPRYPPHYGQGSQYSCMSQFVPSPQPQLMPVGPGSFSTSQMLALPQFSGHGAVISPSQTQPNLGSQSDLLGRGMSGMGASLSAFPQLPPQYPPGPSYGSCYAASSCPQLTPFAGPNPLQIVPAQSLRAYADTMSQVNLAQLTP